MAQGGAVGLDTLFKMSLPHILEKIFLSLDFESCKTCYEVNKEWKELITSKYFQEKAKIQFELDIEDDEMRLCEMSGRGESAEVRRLLSFGLVDVNYVGWVYNSTPLNGAAQSGHIDVVKLLLDEGADPSKPDDENGQTPLHWAAVDGHIEMVKILLDRGAEPNKIDGSGDAPLHGAAYKGHNEVVKLLLDGGADPNEVGDYERTPLYWAIEGHYEDTVKTLMDRGAEPDKTADSDIDRDTELHAAVNWGNRDVVQRLLDAGAQPNKTNENGYTAAELARVRGHAEILEIIMDAGGTLDINYLTENFVFFDNL